jgi:PAS domain S-box-containing protein
MVRLPRRHLKNDDIPVVFLSSHIDPEIVDKTEKISSYGYVVKNSGLTVLDASMKMALKLFAAKLKMKKVKDKLESTLDALPDLLFEIGSDGRCHDCHSSHGLFSHISHDEIIGKTVDEIFSDGIASAVISAVKEARQYGSSVGKQFQIGENEKNAWIELSVSAKRNDPEDPLFLVLCRDITSRKETEEELLMHKIELQMQNQEMREKQARLEALQNKYCDLYNAAPVSYLSLDENGIIIEANLSASDLMGIAQESLILKSFATFIHADDQDQYYLHRRRLSDSGKPQFCALRIKAANGIMPVFLKAIAAPGVGGSPSCRVILVVRESLLQVDKANNA